MFSVFKVQIRQCPVSYQLPTYFLKGNLVHFAAFKSHIGFYPAPSGIEAFQQELAVYKSSKGAVQFPIDEPLPLELVGRIVQFRVRENLEKAAQKKSRSHHRDAEHTEKNL